MNDEPSTNGHAGRYTNGKFAPGNKLGRGNPFNKRSCELRAALMESVSAVDMKEIIAAIVMKARNGDLAAAALLLDRCLGKAATHDLTARVELLEERLLGDASDE